MTKRILPLLIAILMVSATLFALVCTSSGDSTYIDLTTITPYDVSVGWGNLTLNKGLDGQSLDMANKTLSETFRDDILQISERIKQIKSELKQQGFSLIDDELLKITIETKKYGYLGTDFAKILNEKGIVAEFCDPDFVVLMITPEIENLDEAAEILLSIPRLNPIKLYAPSFQKLERATSVREAILSPSELLPTENCLGRTVADSSVGCPPAVPIALAGEIVDENALKCFKYYGINIINVVK